MERANKTVFISQLVFAVFSICFILLPCSARGGDNKDLALIPAGSFIMGSELLPAESPPHEVFVNAFYIDKYEVTNGEYFAFLEATGHNLPLFWNTARYHSGLRFKDRPVIGISWYDATAYCKWKGKRLPTEAEWEKAAQGTLSGKKYPWGNVPDMTFANFAAPRGSKVVGSYKANTYGLYDMAGNVWEWCQDYFDDDHYANFKKNKTVNNPKGPAKGKYRVVRGGSWYFGYHQMRNSYRGWFTPAEGSFDIGCRCAKSK